MRYVPKYNTNTQFNKVLIIGLGQIGASRQDMFFFKKDLTLMAMIGRKAMERAEELRQQLKKAINFSEFDVYILCVST